MKMTSKKIFMTAALAGLMAVATAAKAADDTTTAPAPSGDMMKGECHGVNACKGQGACGGEGHSCAGKNACKGQGWLEMTKADCDAKGGTFKSKS